MGKTYFDPIKSLLKYIDSPTSSCCQRLGDENTYTYIERIISS